MYVLINEVTEEFAAHECAGQHDGKFTPDLTAAKTFDSYGEASDFSQNFGSDWTVRDYGDAWLLRGAV